MGTKIPKVPSRSKFLDTSLDGMDELFDFPVKELKKAEPAENGYMEMEFSLMEPFPHHKFRLYAGQRLQDMVDSIKNYGILEPLVLWHHDDIYTVLSGHNRMNAARLAGLDRAPVMVKEQLTYDEAVLIVTETNLRQRSFSDLSHSEKALCLKQHYDAIKSQGKRNDLIKEIEELLNPHEYRENQTSAEILPKLNSKEKVGDEYNLNRDKVVKYIRIATLITPLLDKLDDKEIPFEAAYDISFLKDEALQLYVSDLITTEGFKVDLKKAGLIREYCKKGDVSRDLLHQILSGEKSGKPKIAAVKPVKLKATVVKKYFSGEKDQKIIMDTIEKALELYFSEQGKDCFE